MPEFFAACTPNSLPNDDGIAEHGWQLNILDEKMAILTTVDLPEWKSFDEHTATQRLATMGCTLRDDPKAPAQDGWTPAGIGHMASVNWTPKESR
ncbi:MULTISPECIES: hypothetical protein [unclassified Streptomyces]|uniref:hypothetical protein n=1 Tax=unclassified Streptomyces TaxID=2593676 RepID=UPI0004CCD153|nr:MULTISPECIES: hypothetical protein [unclassified Streptomyces]